MMNSKYRLIGQIRQYKPLNTILLRYLLFNNDCRPETVKSILHDKIKVCFSNPYFRQSYGIEPLFHRHVFARISGNRQGPWYLGL